MSFDAAWAAARDIEGWLTEDQARRLFAAAADVRAGGMIVEIGSFRGRSAIVLGRAARPDVEVICIDPHVGSDRGPQEITAQPALGESDAERFGANLRAAGVDDRIRHVRRFSSDAHDEVRGMIDVLYVDGAHRLGPARDDLVDWGARVGDGGRMLVHDAFSSVGVTLALLMTTLPARRWRYVGRERSLAEFVREPGGAADVARQLAQLPWFARNLVLKALVRARLRRGPWPY